MGKSFSGRRISLCKIFYFVLFPAILAVLMWQISVFFAGKVSAETASNQSSHFHSGKSLEKNNELADSPVFAEFNAWTERHLDGDFSDFARHGEVGENLAVQRRQVLKELIQIDPQAAIERAVTEETFERLPDFISRHLEKRISARGDFLVAVADEIDRSSGEPVSHQTLREAVFGDVRFKAFVFGRRAGMTTKFDIPLRGVALDEVMALEEKGWRKIEPSEYQRRGIDAAKLGENGVVAEIGGETIYFASDRQFQERVRDLVDWEMKIAPARFDARGNRLSPWTEGAKTILYIRVDFPDKQGEPVDGQNVPLTVARAQSVMDSSVNPFYVNNSYSKTSLQTTVTPVVRMPQPLSFYTIANYQNVYVDARNAARAAGFDTDNYNFDLIAFSNNPNFGFAGAANIGAKGFVLNGAFDFKTTAHELGHCYGLVHANLWRTTDGTVIGNGSNLEYGDGFDVMGSGGSQVTHFNASYKRALDWLGDVNVRTVTQSGTYRIFAHDTSANPTAGANVLKIRKDGSKNYVVEFRQAITGAPALMNGAALRWDIPFVEGNRRQTQLLDITPSTPSIADAPLVIGQTFTDNSSGITITPLGKGNTTPESLDVKIEFNYSIINGAPFDFDGDNKSDIGVFRPSDRTWYLNRSSQGFTGINWGLATDKIAPAKLNFDRTTDVTVFRDGVWYMHNPIGSPLIQQFGQAGDIPVPADYDGDGAAEMAVYRPSNGTWYLWNWIFQRFTAVQFGISTDKPVPADYDGDGKIDIAVFRPENGYWYLLRSSQGFTGVQFGISEDKPVTGDYDGDGKADVAVFRPSSGTWYLLGSTAGFSGAQFGISTDLPAPADYDGDGKTDLSVFRDGVWYLLRSSQGFTAIQFGAAGDTPVANAFVP